MDQNTQAALAEFRHALETTGAGLPEYLQLLMGLMESNAMQTAYALMGHTMDIMKGMAAGEEIPYHDLIAASYSRTFCEPEHIVTYGGDLGKLANTDVPGFLRSLATGLMQLAQSENPQQLAMALEADTTNRH